MVSQTQSAALPGSMAGNPAGPGASPMAAPGAGAGNEANAVAKLKGISAGLWQIASAFPPGGEDSEHMLKAIQEIHKIIGKHTEGESIVPSAIQQMMMAAKQGGALKGAPPVGIQPAPPNPGQPQEPEAA